MKDRHDEIKQAFQEEKEALVYASEFVKLLTKLDILGFKIVNFYANDGMPLGVKIIFEAVNGKDTEKVLPMCFCITPSGCSHFIADYEED